MRRILFTASLAFLASFFAFMPTPTLADDGAPSPPPSSPCPTLTPSGHPVDCRGFVLDGSPQQNDERCVGSPDQTTACKLARRPECRDRPYMDRQTATDCWAPEINDYDWDRLGMFDALYCESKGAEMAWTHSTYHGLFQSDQGAGDAVLDFHDAYYDKWTSSIAAGQSGGQPWRGTFGVVCSS